MPKCSFILTQRAWPDPNFHMGAHHIKSVFYSKIEKQDHAEVSFCMSKEGEDCDLNKVTRYVTLVRLVNRVLRVSKKLFKF